MLISYGAVEAQGDSELGDDTIKNQNDAIIKARNYGHERNRSFLTAIVSAIVMLIAAVSLVLLANSRQEMMRNKKENLSAHIFMDTQKKFVIASVSNDYGFQNASTMLPYPFLKDSFLMEPYKEATIALDSPYFGCSYDWSLTKVSDGEPSGTGSSTDGTITATLTTVGEYIFEVKESCDDTTDSSRGLSMSVWVKYVRREISTLNDNDREEFLDAFHTLWTVSTTEGQAIYGERYKSVNYFATLHNDGGGNAACDEFHGGLGFLNNHMYISAYLEQSLQMVNPKVALHYMEYSKYFEDSGFRGHLTNQLDGGSWTEILTAKFFGASDPLTGRITDGRWENASVPYVTQDFFEEEGIDPVSTFFPVEQTEWLANTDAHLSSPYGLLRSPWNYNPSPLVTRYGDVYRIANFTSIGANRNLVFKLHMGVVCDDYTSFFVNVNGKSFETYLLAIENDTHGIFHFTFGGVGGERAVAAVRFLKESFGFTDSNIATLAVSAQPFFKKNLALSHDYPVNCTSNPWQNGALLTDAAPGSTEGPHCDFSDYFYESEDNLEELISSFFEIDLDEDDSVISRLADLDFESRSKAMKLIGNMFPYDGDLAGSGAALDPLFWVAHGAMERIFQKAVFSDIFTDMSYTSTGHCSGHNANKPKSWLDGFFFLNETVITNTLTNAELTYILSPTSDGYRDLVNFVYDLSSFDWCEDAGAWFRVVEEGAEKNRPF